MTTTAASSGTARYLPIMAWLPTYQAGWLRLDLVAGLTAAAVVIPQAMAYAAVAGLPVEAGHSPGVQRHPGFGVHGTEQAGRAGGEATRGGDYVVAGPA